MPRISGSTASTSACSTRGRAVTPVKGLAKPRSPAV
jgi:hypothetical protein